MELFVKPELVGPKMYAGLRLCTGWPDRHEPGRVLRQCF